jgi:hypothetical protein
MINMTSLSFSMAMKCLLLSIGLLSTVSVSVAGERFQPRGCEFSVEFPGKPRIYDVSIPKLGKVQNAEYKGGTGKASDTYVFVAEGMPVSRREILKYHKDYESYLMDSIQSYVQSNGIKNPEYRYFKDPLGDGIVMRGYKTINGVSAIYSAMSVLGNKSMICLRVGCAAALFPPPNMTPFMKSIKREEPNKTGNR